MVNSLASNIILALVVVLMTLLRQNKPLQKWFVSYVEKLLSRKSNLAQKVSVLSPSLKLVDVEKSISADQSNLSKINYQIPTLPDLTGNLIRLHEYRARGEGYNGLLFRRARQLNGISEDQLQKLGYFTKLMKNNEGIRENARVIDKIIEFTLGN